MAELATETWKPDFTKANPYEGAPPEYFEKEAKAYVPTPTQPLPPSQQFFQQNPEYTPTTVTPTPTPAPTPSLTPTPVAPVPTTPDINLAPVLEREQDLRDAIDFSERVKSGEITLEEGIDLDKYWSSVDDIRTKLSIIEQAKKVQAGELVPSDTETYQQYATAATSPYATHTDTGYSFDIFTALKAGMSEAQVIGLVGKDYFDSIQTFANTVKEISPRLYRVLTTEGVEAYNKAIGAEEFVASDFKKKHTQLSDGWIANVDLDKTKEDSPELYKILTTKGFSAASIYIDKQRALYEKNQLALSMLEKYTNKEGGVDGAKYLRDNPKDTNTLRNAGFTDDQIKEWTDYNKQPWVGETPREKYHKAIIQAGGDLYQTSSKYWDNFWEKHPEIAILGKESTQSPIKYEKPTVSLQQFTTNFLASRGLEPVPFWDKQHKKVGLVKELAEAEYSRLYGVGATVSSLGTQGVALVFAPARVLHPEIEFRDIRGTEWAIGAAQVALLSLPLIGKGISTIATPLVTRGAIASTSLAAGGVFTAETVRNWNEMSTSEKTVAVAMDTLIIGASLIGFGLPFLRGKLGTTKTTQVNTTTQQATNTTARIAGKPGVRPTTWIQKRVRLNTEISRLKKQRVQAEALDKRIAEFAEVKELPKGMTWAQAHRRRLSIITKQAEEAAKQEARMKYLERSILKIQKAKLKELPKKPWGQKLREAHAKSKELAKQEARAKALEKRLKTAQQEHQVAKTWIQRRLESINKVKQSIKESKRLEAREKYIEKKLKELERQRLPHKTWAQARREALARSKAKAQEIARLEARARYIEQQLAKIRKAKLKARPKKSWLQIYRDSLTKARIVKQAESRVKTIEKRLNEVRKARQQSLNTITKLEREAATLVRNSRQRQWAEMQRMLKEATRQAEAEVRTPLSGEIKQALGTIDNAIRKGNVKLLREGARQLQIAAAYIPKQLGGNVLRARAQLLLDNPRRFLQLTKGKGIAAEQVTELEQGLNANRGFIRDSERFLRKVKDPTRKAAIEKTLKEARRQVQTAIKEKPLPIVDSRIFPTGKYLPARVTETTKAIAKTRRKQASFTKQVVKTRTRQEATPGFLPKEKVEARTKRDDIVVIPIHAFRQMAIGEIVPYYELESEDALVWAVAATNPAIQQRIRQAMKDRVTEQTKIEEKTKVIPSPVTKIRPEPLEKPKPIEQPSSAELPKPEEAPEPFEATKLEAPKLSKLAELERTKPLTWISTTKEKELAAPESKGIITWRQGFVWWVIFPPYRSKQDVKCMKTPPKGAKVVKGIGSAYKTIQLLGGDANIVLDIDMGAFDVLVRRPKGTGKIGTIKFKRDIKQRTRGDISLAGIKAS